MPDFDILVAGEINPDLILSSPGLTVGFNQQETLIHDMKLAIGSSSAIFACGAARLGLKVAMIGVIGDDLYGDFMVEALSERGVDVSNVIRMSSLHTGISVILNRGNDRAILTYLGAINALQADMISDNLLQRSRHLHVASYFLQTALQPGLPDLFCRAHHLSLSTSLDTNWDPAGHWNSVDELLDLTDIFLPNETEAVLLSDAKIVDEALAKLASRLPVIAIKQGPRGAIAQHGDVTSRVPALNVTIADTVGAGDSFDAGFMYGYLAGWSLERCLNLAIACGSLSTRAYGGTDAQPTLEEAIQALNTIPPSEM